MQTLQPYVILSQDRILGKDIDKSEVSSLYKQIKWREATTQLPLGEILSLQQLLIIRTDNLVVLDFDDNDHFNKALAFNSSLNEAHQCQLIVKSTRKGGHFYFNLNPQIDEPAGHTRQRVLDYLSGPGHNVLGPTPGDSGKIILHQGKELTSYSVPWDTFVKFTIIQNLPDNQAKVVLRDPNGHSDDNKDFVKLYISNSVKQGDFDRYYNIPDPIPQGMSNHYYLQLSTRLGRDETISWEDYVSVFNKFNDYHARKTANELESEILHRMRPQTDGTSINGLWRYDPDKSDDLLTFPHRRYRTTITPFYDINTGEYLMSYQDGDGVQRLDIRRTKTLYVDLMEKIARASAVKLKKTENIMPVECEIDYGSPYGFKKDQGKFNKAIAGPELAAFHGTKPEGYRVPTRLLEVCKYMWGDEYNYLLGATKFRYDTFKFSPVITFLQGVEGSGKDLTVWLLTKPFPASAQLLDDALVKDKHSNWQTEPNAIVSEVGDWSPMARDSLLAKMKTISGSNGVVTYRGIQQVAITVQSLIKLWVTGNKWVKLHTDPLSQRRIHAVYMPRPLNVELGGPYTEGDLRDIFSVEAVLNFYYWLGNESDVDIPLDQYIVPTTRQKSESYRFYMESTQNPSDMAAALIYSREYPKFMEALELFDLTLVDFEYKKNKHGNILLSAASVKEVFGRRSGGDVINRTIDRLVDEKEGGKRLRIQRQSVEKYITLYEVPADLIVAPIGD